MPLDYESLADGGLAARHRRDHGDGRDRLRRRGRAAHGAVLRARVVRQVHAVPRRQLVGRRGSWAGSRTATGASEDIPLMHDMGTNILFRAFCALADGTASVDQLLAEALRATSTRSTSGWAAARCERRSRRGRGGGLAGWPPTTDRHAHDRRQGGHGAEGHADHPRGRTARRRDPALLRPPAAGARRRVPPVLRPDRGPAQARRPRARWPWRRGMVVHTQNTNDAAHEAQVANLEFLLLNHPLDCPICDRGGECPLQDQALAFGPGRQPLRRGQAHLPEAIPLSPLVDLDRERCVLCARCTRFCDEISGDRFIELFERGAGRAGRHRGGRGLPVARSAATPCRSARSAR